jgi:hypothetical protein
VHRISHAYSRRLAPHAQVGDSGTSSSAIPLSVSPSAVGGVNAAVFPLNRTQELRRTVLLSICARASSKVDLLHLSRRQWDALLMWLDISGMALYLFEHLKLLGMHDALPPTIRQRLQQNMDDNTKRTRGMVEESVVLQLEFQKAGLSYAVMKGLSLSPVAVPRPELRHQFDLDYLVSESSAPEARRILERRGYSLYGMSGKSWEFKINETPYVSIKDLYKDLPYRAVELHLESGAPEIGSRLKRSIQRTMFGISMPVFSPVDLFLHQTMHVFKDVCSAHTRTAHILEFYRHVLARYSDDTFWHELRVQTEGDLRACLGIGVVTYLVSLIVGNFAPPALTEWTSDQLPASVRLWIDLYGRRVAFGDHPGNKLYLLLQKELEAAGIPRKRSNKPSLLPRTLPPLVIRATPNETFMTRLARYRVQVRYLSSRLYFHIVESVRYALELRRWRQRLERLSS